MDIALRLVEHHVWLVSDLIDHADAFDDLALDTRIATPNGEDATIRSLLSLLVGQLDQWLAAAEGKQPPDHPPQTIGELRLRHGEVGRRFVELVRSVVREERAEDVFTDGTADHPDVLTYGGMIAHLLVTAAPLRALAVSALRLAGAALRYGDPMLFLTDRPPPAE